VLSSKTVKMEAAQQDVHRPRRPKGPADGNLFLTILTSELQVSCASSLIVTDGAPADLDLCVKHLYQLSCTCKSLASTCEAVAMLAFDSKLPCVRANWPRQDGESWLRALWRAHVLPGVMKRLMGREIVLLADGQSFPGYFAFGPEVSCEMSWKAPLTATQPLLADTDLTNVAALRGHIALCRRGRVTFTDKARRAAEAGAQALLCVDTEGDAWACGMCGGESSIPVVIVRLCDEGKLLAASHAALTITVETPADATTVVGFLKRYGADAVISFSSCGKLADLIIDKGQEAALLTQAVLAAGGVEAVTATMRTHPSDERVQTEALHLLWRVMEGEETKLMAKAMVLQAESVATIVAAMGAVPVEEVQLAAVTALSSLLDIEAADGSSPDDISGTALYVAMVAAAKVLEAGGAAAVVRAMEAHPTVLVMRMDGMIALSNLAHIPDGCAAVRAARGAEVVRAVMESHPDDDPHVRDIGAGLLGLLESN
jgi:peroxiredoxin family protein